MRTCDTRLPDASSTVTAMDAPSSVNTRVIPTLRVTRPIECELIVFSYPATIGQARKLFKRFKLRGLSQLLPNFTASFLSGLARKKALNHTSTALRSARQCAHCSLISTSTPAGRSSFIKASTVLSVGSTMSIRRKWVRISN
ncbi:protein of unknown function [Thiomonas sp. Bio17B3]|nr:protein of unknown function [Thiomonas sp. Bio17B3]VDY08048.1 protein of unknown function [Thiomonas sp. Sup16B3]VDY17761.1 protein of unknown function [Thiomonas sp. CB2]